MGYTHYYERNMKEVSRETWNAMIKEIRQAVTVLKMERSISLAGGLGKDRPVFSRERIWFNGPERDDLGHETFDFYRVMNKRDLEFNEELAGVSPKRKEWFFNCCKTAHKPYDIVVCAVLLIMKKHLKDGLRIGSDGFGTNDDGTMYLDEIWVEAIKFMESIGNKVVFATVREESEFDKGEFYDKVSLTEVRALQPECQS